MPSYPHCGKGKADQGVASQSVCTVYDLSLSKGGKRGSSRVSLMGEMRMRLTKRWSAAA